MRNPLKKHPAAEPKPAPFTHQDIEFERQLIVDSYNRGHIQLSQLRSRLAELKALQADLAPKSTPPLPPSAWPRGEGRAGQEARD